MQIDIDKLKDVFSYHPPDTERAKKHSGWNDLVVDFVVASAEYIQNEEDYLLFLNKMQQIRMLGNQTITNQSLGLNYRDIFE